MVNVFDAKSGSLAKIIDSYVANNNKQNIKQDALEIGLENFSVENLKEKYIKIINE